MAFQLPRWSLLSRGLRPRIDMVTRREAERQPTSAYSTLVEQIVQLQAANTELEAFSYSVSHDLRAPLRAIDGYSEVLEDEHGDELGPSGKDALRRVRAAAGQMGTLIDEMIGLSRLSRVEIRREPVDVTAMASAVMNEVARGDDNRQVRVDIETGLQAHADPPLLRIALTNLLENAWKYSAKTASARIDVGCSETNGTRVYHVRDNGAGFDMAYASKLFGAFQRLHSDREFEGTGIGLATVQRIILRHGGRIWADATPGAGATFRFTLERTPQTTPS